MKKKNFGYSTLVQENRAAAPLSSRQQDDKVKIPMIEKNEPSSWLVAIACLSFFPMMYLLGKTVMSWLG